MKRKLIIDGNAVYEIDEDCMLKKRLDQEENNRKNREENRNRGREPQGKDQQER